MKCNNIKINTLILMKRQLSTLLNLILVIILFVLFLVYLYILPLRQLPSIILTSALSALFFYFIYYGLTYSNNTYIRLLQKCIVFSFCFYVPVLIGVIFDLYLFNAIFSTVNVSSGKDFISIVISSPNETYDISLPKKPVDVITKAFADIAVNVNTNIGNAVIKNIAFPPIPRTALAITTAGLTSTAVTIGPQGGAAIVLNLNSSSAIRNHPYANPNIDIIPSPDSTIINCPLENGDLSSPLVDLLHSIVSLNYLELLILIVIVIVLFNKYFSNLFSKYSGSIITNKYIKISSEFHSKYMNFLLVFLLLLLLIVILMNLIFSSVLYTQIDDYILVYNHIKGKSS